MRTKKRKYRRVTCKRAYARKHTKRARRTYRKRTRNNRRKRRQRGGAKDEMYKSWKARAEGIIQDAKNESIVHPDLEALIAKLPKRLGKKEYQDPKVIKLINNIAIKSGLVSGQPPPESRTVTEARRQQQATLRRAEPAFGQHIGATRLLKAAAQKGELSEQGASRLEAAAEDAERFRNLLGPGSGQGSADGEWSAEAQALHTQLQPMTNPKQRHTARKARAAEAATASEQASMTASQVPHFISASAGHRALDEYGYATKPHEGR